MSKLNWIVAGIFCLLSKNIHAGLVTVSFNGTIDGYLSTADTSVISLPVGTPFSGTFTFGTSSLAASYQESGVLSYDADYDYSIYRFTGQPYGFNVAVGGQNYSIDQTSVYMRDTATAKPDKFSASTVDTSLSQNHPQGIFFQVTLDAQSNTYSDTSLPAGYPLGFFHSEFLVGVQGSDGSVVYAAIGQLDNISQSAVPLPAAAWLFASGLLGLFAVQRRTS